jgi:uncharacterized membrane protein
MVYILCQKTLRHRLSYNKKPWSVIKIVIIKNLFNNFYLVYNQDMEKIQKTWHQKYTEMSSVWDKLSDWVTEFVGSWLFVIIHIVWFTIWLVLDIEPFPYGLLTMIVSLEAILLSTFIMMSQNRQADRDRVQSRADYETNIAAKEEIEDVQNSLKRIESEKLEEILKLLRERK